MQLEVPGASLFYSVRGQGATLLLVPGGAGDAALYEPMAAALADRFRVVTYERRGFSRSALPESAAVDDGTRLATDAEDAAKLLEHLGAAPAHVFGSSSGAIVALEMLARRPDAVKTVLAHEPPLVTVLPDAAELLAFLDDVYATYRSEGVAPAMQKFGKGSGTGAFAAPMMTAARPELKEMLSRLRGNVVFWLEHEVRQYPRARVDFDLLAQYKDRLILLGGEESREHFPYRPNAVIAERLGLELVDMPGDHVGYLPHAADFADTLAVLLEGR